MKTLILILGGVLFAGAMVAVLLLLPAREESVSTTQTVQQPAVGQEAIQEETQMQDTTPAQAANSATTSTITFPAADGLAVTGDLYLSGDIAAPFILLFHQADYSRGEYLEIAPKLVSLGYNCLAIDQRSGRAANGIANETNKAAKEQKLATGYTDAYADLEAALSYVTATYAPKKLIVWGSSYSSSLSLILASQHPQEISAVLAFSPGEYFNLGGKQVADYAANITQPAFITSAKSEGKAWSGIAEAITSKGCVFFLPQGAGKHGSSALFEKTSNHAEYWTAVESFLASLT
jgi:pimeloyl-ACP methyl ester carboxylesterase